MARPDLEAAAELLARAAALLMLDSGTTLTCPPTTEWSKFMGVRGTGRLYLRGETWWLDISAGGQRMRISTGIQGGKVGSPPKEAELFRAKKLGELGRFGPAGLSSGSVLISDLIRMLIERYTAENRASLTNVKVRMRAVLLHLGGWKAHELRTDRLLSYAVMRRDVDGMAVATINTELDYLRRAYSIAREAGRLMDLPPPFPHLPGANVRRGYVTDAGLASVLSHIKPWMAAAVRFLRLTGWRLQESLDLEWGRVDWEAQELRLDTSKTGEPRSLVFSTYEPLRVLLAEQRASAETIGREQARIIPWVFHQPDGRPLNKWKLELAWRQASAHGCPGTVLHDLRRTMVREMEAKGVPRSVAMSITGHRSEAVYRRYAIVDREAQEAGLAKLAQPAEERVVGFRANPK